MSIVGRPMMKLVSWIHPAKRKPQGNREPAHKKAKKKNLVDFESPAYNTGIILHTPIKHHQAPTKSTQKPPTELWRIQKISDEVPIGANSNPNCNL